MALVSHTIISRYTPQEREPITQPVDLEDDPWQTESSFGPAQRLHSRPAPFFVAASLEYDEYGMPKAGVMPRPERPESRAAAEDVSAWYRSLTGKGKVRQEHESKPSRPSPSNAPPKPSSGPSSRHSSVEAQPSSSNGGPPPTRRPNWFTSWPLPADPSLLSKPSTLADLLSRNPPPLPSEPAFKPPIFLALGPANKGFTMLQRKGWQEGEGLGGGRVERRPREGLGMKRRLDDTFQWEPDAEERKPIVSRTGRLIKTLIEGADREVIDLTISDSEHDVKRAVVDLTLSDSESATDFNPEETDDRLPPSNTPPPEPHGMTLLTPITTTLKADRLGIGLKAVRRPSAKAKAVTHTSAALAAHIRSGNQARKEKAKHGRGSRGFARSKRKGERERLGMLAYLNS